MQLTYIILPPFPGAEYNRMAQAFAVRRRVFIEEQNVPEEEELDRLDRAAWHWLALDGQGQAVATARLVLLEAGLGKIGRVAVDKPYRGTGIGRALMLAIIEEAHRRKLRELKLDSQTHALPFYEKLGFNAYGDEFEDAGIPHRHMRLAIGDG